MKSQCVSMRRGDGGESKYLCALQITEGSLLEKKECCLEVQTLPL